MTPRTRGNPVRALVALGALCSLAASAAFAQDARTEIVAPEGEVEGGFASGLAVDGVTLFAGSPRATESTLDDAGAGWIYTLTDETWEQTQRLASPTPAVGGQFGHAAHMSGSVLIVGAPGSADTGVIGHAYVFRLTDGVWSLEADLLPPTTPVPTDQFGFAVSVAGDRAVVGAPGAVGAGEAAEAGAGNAYVFERIDGAWTFVSDLADIGPATSGSFGFAVDVEGGTVVVGAPADSGLGNVDGSASVFRLTQAGGWARAQILHPEFAPIVGSGNMIPEFGCAVSLSGTALAVAACGAELRRIDEGVITIYRRHGPAFRAEQQLRVGTSAGHFRRFGQAMQLSGDNLVAGCWRHVTADGQDWGDAFVFRHDDGIWTKVRRVISRSQYQRDHFGSAIALSGRTAVFGGPFDDRAASNAGALYIEEGVGVAAPEPELSPSTLSQLTSGRIVEIPFEFAGATPPIVFDDASGDLPVVGSFDSATGVLAGTVRDEGEYEFTVSATDADGRRASAAFVTTVVGSVPTQIGTLPVAIADRAYRGVLDLDALTAGEFVFSAPLPAGLALDPFTGVITGAPEESGLFSVDLTVGDGAGQRVVPASLLIEEVLDVSRRRHVEELTDALAGRGEVVRVLELIRGTRIDVKVTSRGSPDIAVLDNDEQPLDLTGLVRRRRGNSRRSAVKVRGLIVPATGRYTVRVQQSADVRARLVLRVHPPTRFFGSGDVTKDTVLTGAFTALPGAEALISARPVGGSDAVPFVKSVRDPAAGELLRVDSSRFRGRSVRTLAIVPPTGGGNLSVDFSALGLTSGAIRWTVRVRQPSAYTFLLPNVGAGN